MPRSHRRSDDEKRRPPLLSRLEVTARIVLERQGEPRGEVPAEEPGEAHVGLLEVARRRRQIARVDRERIVGGGEFSPRLPEEDPRSMLGDRTPPERLPDPLVVDVTGAGWCGDALRRWIRLVEGLAQLGERRRIARDQAVEDAAVREREGPLDSGGEP